MSSDQIQKRSRSQFQKGMTLDQYFRGMAVEEDTVPTADSLVGPRLDQQQNLYKTSHCFYQPEPKYNALYAKEIREQNFEDSLECYRQSVNIVSSNLKPMNKKLAVQAILNEEPRKNYRIRGGKSMSPYNQHVAKLETKKTISPYKTFMKKFYQPENQHKNCEQQITPKQSNNLLAMTHTFYGKQFEPKRNNKNLQNQSPFCPQQNAYNLPKRNEQMFEKQLNKYPELPLFTDKIGCETDRVEFRVQNLKDRLQMKRKYKNK